MWTTVPPAKSKTGQRPPVDVQDSAHAPDHVRQGAVDEQRPEDKKDGHGAELDALGEGAGDERRGDDGEHELVDHKGLLGDGAAVVGVRSEADAAQKDVLKAADEAVARAEGQRVADQRPQDGNQSHHGKALHHGGENVFAADQAAIEEDQAGGGHHEDQRSGDQHPGVVAGGLSVADGLLEGGDLGLGGGRRGAQVGGDGQRYCRDTQQGGEKQQFDCATKHKDSTPKNIRWQAEITHASPGHAIDIRIACVLERSLWLFV